MFQGLAAEKANGPGVIRARLKCTEAAFGARYQSIGRATIVRPLVSTTRSRKNFFKKSASIDQRGGREPSWVLGSAIGALTGVRRITTPHRIFHPANDPAIRASRVLVRPVGGQPLQSLAAIFGFRLHGCDFPGDLVRNRMGLAQGNFSYELDAADGLAARKFSGTRP